MKKFLVLISFLLFTGCATTQQMTKLEQKVADLEQQILMPSTELAGSSGYHCSGGLIGGGVGALDKIVSPADNDIAYVHFNGDATYGNSTLIYTFDIDADAGEDPPWSVAPNTGSGEWELSDVFGRKYRSLSFTNAASQTAFSIPDMLSYSAINNQGAGEETDIILVAVSYPIKFTVETSEAFQIELCPPAGEIFTQDGTPLDANDCILSSATVGSSFMVKRIQIADGSWQYFTYTIQGVNTDGGAAD